jgi:hypothetical protein
MNWKAESAAIVLAPAIYRAWCVAQSVDTERPAFHDMPYAERDLWILLSEMVLDSIRELGGAFSGAVPPTVDDSLFQQTAEMTRKRFAAIRGGKQ